MAKKILLHLFIAIVMLVLVFSDIEKGISPFAGAFLFSLVLVPMSKIFPMIVFITASLFKDSAQINAISTLFVCGVFLFAAFLFKSIGERKRLYLPLLIIFFAISQAYNIYISVGDNLSLAKTLVSVLVGIIFLQTLYVTIRTIRQKKFLLPWTIDQIVCLMSIVIIFALGLAGFENIYFDIHKFFVVLVIFFGVFYADSKATVMVAAALGLGKSFASNNLVFVATAVLLCIACLAFKHRNRTYSIVALLFTDFVIGFYFNAYGGYSGYSLLPILVAVLVFLCLPMSVSRFFTFGSGGIGGFLVSKNTINRNTAGISTKMRSLSNVFNEMQNTYRNLTHTALPPNETALMICGEINSNICANCPNKEVCRKTTSSSKDIDEGITDIARTALKRGQVSLLDVSNTLSIKCTRINTLLNAINKAIIVNKNKQQIIAGLDSGKILMANLLSGVSQLCGKFASDICRTVVFDNERAELVKEELLYSNIFAEDCLITKTGKNEFVVSVLIPRGETKSRRIEKIVSSVCGHKMIIDEIVDADTKGFSIVSVRSAPKYSVLFGMAGVTKGVNEKSGDTFSFLRITNDKTLMALCDGMGAGERAARASTLALTLVENFYKAGFPDEIIMYSVNQLLSFTGQDIFSALDICIFDLATGDVNFVKVGAADGFIKRGREVEVVEAGSLPLGILDEIEPKITKAILTGGDMVVLVSDGVLDAFGGERVALAGFINNLDSFNPQEVADKVIAEVMRRSSKFTADDCTVTVAKLLLV